MAASAGAVYVDVRGNTKPFESSMSGLGGIASKIGGVIAAAFTAKAVFDFGRQCVELASDLNEVQNVVDVTFSHMSGKVDEWAQGAAESFGLSETMAKRYVGTFGSMAEAFGFAESEAYDMATALTGLAGDVASFYNMSQDAAYTKLKSVFSGETESLKELGVVMTQSALDQYALANGYGRTTAAMSEQEKVSLRLAFVQNALSNASGDFARTSGSWANQTRLLSLRFEELKATLGQSMIAVLLPVVRALNGFMAACVGAAQAFNRFVQTITGKSMGELTGGAASAGAAIADTASVSSDAAGSLAGLANAQGDAADAAGAQEKAQTALNKALAGFDKINRLSSDSTSTGGGDAGTGGMDVLGDVGGFGADVAAEVAEAQAAFETLKLPQRLLDSIANLRGSVSELAGTIREGLGWAFDNVLKPLGEFTLGTVLPDALDLVSDKVGHFKTFLEDISDPLSRFATMVTEGLMRAWTEVLQPLADWKINEANPRIMEALGTAIDIVVTVLEKLKPVAEFLWEEVLIPVGQFLGDVFVAALDVVNDALDWLLEQVSQADFSGFVECLRSAKTWLVDHLQPAFEVVGEVAHWLWENVLVPFGKFLGEAFPVVLDALDGALGVLGGAFDALGDAAQWVWDNVLSPLGDFLGGTFKGKSGDAGESVGLLSGAFDALKKAAQWVWEHVLQPIGEFLGGAFSTAAGVAKGAVSGFKGVWDGITDKAATLTTTVAAAAGGTVSALKSAWDGVTDKASQLTTKVVAAKGGAVSTLKTAWSAVKDKTAQLTTKATDAIKGGLSGLKSSWAAIKSKTATLSAKASQTPNTIKSWWSDRAGKWKDKTASYTVSKDGTPVASIRNWWSARSDEWKNKTSWFNLNAGTTANTVSGWWSNVAGQWYDKTAYLTMESKVTGVRKISIKPGKEGINDIYSVTPEYFAQGGWVARNTPRLAVIGDNRREGEIVSPESKFQSMLDKAAGGSDASALLPVLRDILGAIESLDPDVYLDGQAITRRVVSNVNAQTRSTGRCAILV